MNTEQFAGLLVLAIINLTMLSGLWHRVGHLCGRQESQEREQAAIRERIKGLDHLKPCETLKITIKDLTSQSKRLDKHLEHHSEGGSA